MSDRLAELRRQRTLVQQHLDWLDREISAAQAHTAAANPSTSIAASAEPVSAAVTAPLSKPAEQATGADEVSDQILQEYRVPSESLQQDVRKGCLLYFTAGFMLFLLGIVALYFLVQRE
jgi:hypothetical protein